MDVTSHMTITRAALAALPERQRQQFADQADDIANLYSLYPDIWRWKATGETHDNAVKYGRIPVAETEPYSALPDGSQANVGDEDQEPATRHYIEHILEALKADDRAAAAKFIGAYAHYLEDHGCAAHISGQVLGSLTQLDPPPDPDQRGFVSLHYLFENEDTPYPCDLTAYRPALMGRAVDEALFHLRERYFDIERAKLATVLPYLRALYQRDAEAARRAQAITGNATGEVLADFLFTVLSMASKTFDRASCDRLKSVHLSDVTCSASKAGVCDAYFGAAIKDASLGEFTDFGWPRKPLALRTADGEKTFARGLGMGIKMRVSYDLKGLFTRFHCLVGVHPTLGREGQMAFAVEVDGRTVFDSGTMTARDEARALEIPLDGARTLTLITNRTVERPGSSGRRTPDHGVWADPVLLTE